MARHGQQLFAAAPAGRLYAIVDADACAAENRSPAEVARAFLNGGARWLQLRCKAMPSGPFLDLTNAILEDIRAADATLIVNDRADIVRLAGADGLHIGQTDLTSADSRAVIGSEVILGLSTHAEDQWQRALTEAISYLAIGPTFGTTTKNTGYDAVGLKVVARAAAAATTRGIPVVAIGGITIDNARSVIDAGAASVAVIRDLLMGDPESRCRTFLRTLE